MKKLFLFLVLALPFSLISQDRQTENDKTIQLALKNSSLDLLTFNQLFEKAQANYTTKLRESFSQGFNTMLNHYTSNPVRSLSKDAALHLSKKEIHNLSKSIAGFETNLENDLVKSFEDLKNDLKKRHAFSSRSKHILHALDKGLFENTKIDKENVIKTLQKAISPMHLRASYKENDLVSFLKENRDLVRKYPEILSSVFEVAQVDGRKKLLLEALNMNEIELKEFWAGETKGNLTRLKSFCFRYISGR